MTTTVRLLSATATLTLLWACSDSTAPGDTLSDQQMSTDLATSAAPEVATSTVMFADAGIGAGSSALMVPSTTPCTVHSASASAAFSDDSLSYSRTWEYFAGPTCQNAFDAASTDSIAFTAMLAEADHDPRFVSHASRNWTFDVTGRPLLASASTHVWNGAGVGSDTAEHKTPGLDRTYSGLAYDTATSVTFPNPRNSAPPASGTFSRWTTVTVTHVTKGVDKTATISRHIVVTFNGTTEVPLVVYDASSGATLLSCTLDLTARRLAGSCH